MSKIIIDADACPVKEEVYRVAMRYSLKVTLVANSRMRVPAVDWLEHVVVNGGFDAADDWIAENAAENDIVIAGDIPLASRCLKKGARSSLPAAKSSPRTLSVRHLQHAIYCLISARWEPCWAARLPLKSEIAPGSSKVLITSFMQSGKRKNLDNKIKKA